jgi:alpha-glucosidase
LRQVSKYGGGEPGLRRARAMAVVELALPGAVYLYNGEELGLPNVDIPVGEKPDARAGLNGAEHGGDGARVPIPWEGGRPPFSFSRTPHNWLPIPAEWAGLTVAEQLEDPESTLSL